MASNKGEKLIIIEKQMVADISHQYEINGIDVNTAIFYFRIENGAFVVLDPGSFTITTIGGTQYLVVQDTTVQGIATDFQAGYEFIKTSSGYTPIGQADPEVIAAKYNQLEEDFTNMFEYLTNVAPRLDDAFQKLNLTKLGDLQTWVYDATTDSLKAFDVLDLDTAIATAIQAVSDYVDNEAQPKVDEYGREVVERELNLQKDPVVEEIRATGDFEVGRVGTQGNTEVTRIVAQGEDEIIKIDNHVENVSLPHIDDHTDQATNESISEIAVELQTALNTLQDEFDKLSPSRGIMPDGFDFHDLSNLDGRYSMPLDLGRTYLNGPQFDPSVLSANVLIETVLSESTGFILSRLITVTALADTYTAYYESITGNWSNWSDARGTDAIIITVPDESIYNNPTAVIRTTLAEGNGLPFALAPTDTPVDGLLVPGAGGAGTVGFYEFGEVRIPYGALDEDGDQLEVNEYYFHSTTQDGGIKRTNETVVGKIWQKLFQVNYVAQSVGEETEIYIDLDTAFLNDPIALDLSGEHRELALLSEIGDITTLDTNDKSNLTNSINEVYTDLNTLETASNVVIGDVSQLTTTSKQVVGAINELDADTVNINAQLALKADKTELGNLDDLKTFQDSSIVSSMNELYDTIDSIDYNEKRVLDDRLVALIDPANGSWYPSVDMENTIGTGYGKVEGNLSGVIDDNGMYIGPAYTNLSSINEATIIAEANTNSSSAFFLDGEVFNAGENITITYDLKKHTDFDSSESNLRCRVSLRGVDGTVFYPQGISIEPDGHHSISLTLDKDYNRILYYIQRVADDANTVESCTLSDISITRTSSEVPFVPDSAPAGICRIKENWTSLTHSFINVGMTWSGSTHCNFNSSWQDLNEIGYITVNTATGILDHQKFDTIFGNNICKAIGDDGTEVIGQVLYPGITNGYKYPNYSSRSVESFKYWAIYEGQLTQGELEMELAKLKSRGFALPSGVNTKPQVDIPRVNTMEGNEEIGIPANLDTISKSIVPAINEIYNVVGAGGDGNFVSKTGDIMSGDLDLADNELQFGTASITRVLGDLISTTNQGILYGVDNKPTPAELGAATTGDVGQVGDLTTTNKNTVGAINELNAGKFPLTGGTLTGNLTLDHTNPEIRFLSDHSHTAKIVMQSGDTNGTLMYIQSGGQMVLGSGEFPSAMANLLSGSKGTEDLHIGADSTAYIYTGAQTIGSRKTFTFDSSGNFSAPGNITAYSDERLKKNIVEVDVKDKIAQLRLVEYDRVDIDKHEIGVIAQEVQAIFPSVVNEDSDGMLSVDYGKLAVIIALGGA